jgi:hypothetical protein
MCLDENKIHTHTHTLRGASSSFSFLNSKMMELTLQLKKKRLFMRVFLSFSTDFIVILGYVREA